MTETIDSLFVGQCFIHLDQVESTNVFAQDLVSKSKPAEGTVISTSFQSDGRGQIGRSWYGSKGKNAMMSVVLYPAFLSIFKQYALNMAMACAIRLAVAEYLPERDVTIKWPNDIYVDKKKIAGLLIQNSLKGTQIKNSIFGVGLNVNEPVFPKVLPNPTSIFLERGQQVDLKNLRAKLCKYIENYYLKLKNNRLDKILDEYNTHLYLRNETAPFKVDGKIVQGIIQHVKTNGRIDVMVDGKVSDFAHGELQYIHE